MCQVNILWQQSYWDSSGKPHVSSDEDGDWVTLTPAVLKNTRKPRSTTRYIWLEATGDTRGEGTPAVLEEIMNSTNYRHAVVPSDNLFNVPMKDFPEGNVLISDPYKVSTVLASQDILQKGLQYSWLLPFSSHFLIYAYIVHVLYCLIKISACFVLYYQCMSCAKNMH